MIADRTPAAHAAPGLPKPATMPLHPPGLPDDPIMREARFVGWRWVWNAEKVKWDKPPLRPLDGYPASVTKPGDWTDLPGAVSAVTRLGLDGIGIVLTGTEGVTGIDLDKCRDPLTETIEPWAQAIIDRFRSYWEPSASATGIRIFIRAQLPPGRRRSGRIEMYDSGRYLTINGNPGPGASRQFAERQAELDAWHAEIFPPPAPITPRVHRGHTPVSTDDRAVLDHARAAKNGAKFARLYDAGDTGGYASHSEARQALCSLLAFWCEGDQTQCERLFQGSALYREDKWPRERDKVLDIAYSRGDFYRWPATDARVPLSKMDTLPIADDGVDYRAMPHDDLARLAADLAAVAAERGRRLDAIDDLLLCPEMSETEKVTAYVVIKAGARAQGGIPEDAPTNALVVSQKAIACDTGLSRQTIGKKLKTWSAQEYMRKETRGTGRYTKDGAELRETVIYLPGRTLTDNLAMASSWHRPPDAKRHGGNGNRCPKCDGTTIKTTIETKTVKTTIRSCDDCGHVHSQTGRTIGKPTTTYSYSDDTTPPMLDRAAMRGGTVSKMDTPPDPARPGPCQGTAHTACVHDGHTPPCREVDT